MTTEIVKEINTNKDVSLSKLTEISGKIVNIMGEIKDKELKELKTALHTIDITQKDVNTIYHNYLVKSKSVSMLKTRIDLLKVTIQKHYEQMQSDNEYLKRLELIRPKYFKTLEEYNNHLKNVREAISKNIVEGDDKKAMLKLLDDADLHTQDSTGKLSKAFLEHYEKYKNLLNKDTAIYNENISELSKESSLYNEEENISQKYFSEYNKAVKMLESLKKTYAESSSEQEYFNDIIKIIEALFKNPTKLRTFVDGKADGKCSTTLLRTHIKNNMI